MPDDEFAWAAKFGCSPYYTRELLEKASKVLKERDDAVAILVEAKRLGRIPQSWIDNSPQHIREALAMPKDPACQVHRMDTEFAMCPSDKYWDIHVRGKCGCKCTCESAAVRHMLIGGSESPKFIALVDAIVDWAFDNNQILERVSDSSLPWLAKRIENVARWYRKSPAESE